MESRIDVLHLFSGPAGDLDADGVDSSFAGLLAELAKRQQRNVRTRELDYVNCGCDDGTCDRHQAARRFGFQCDNLLKDEVFDRLLGECLDGKYKACVAGIPCNSFCVARFNSVGGGASALRDKKHMWGLRNLTRAELVELAGANDIVRRSLVLLIAVWQSGGEVLIENPPDRSEPGLWAYDPQFGELRPKFDLIGQHRHCARERLPLPVSPPVCRPLPLPRRPSSPLRPSGAARPPLAVWRLPWLQDFIEVTGAKFVDFAQCQFGGDYQKYTRFLITPRWLEAARQVFSRLDGVPCRCPSRHRRRASGMDEHGRYESAKAAKYPREVNRLLARATLLLIRHDGEEPGGDLTWLLGGSARLPMPSVGARTAAMRTLWQKLGSDFARALCDPALVGKELEASQARERAQQPSIRSFYFATSMLGKRGRE
jgi:hypothetical protein